MVEALAFFNLVISQASMVSYRFLLAAAGLLLAFDGPRAAGARETLAPRSTVLPIVINTWAFTNATQTAWNVINDPNSLTPALDAVEQVLLVHNAISASGCCRSPHHLLAPQRIWPNYATGVRHV